MGRPPPPALVASCSRSRPSSVQQQQGPRPLHRPMYLLALQGLGFKRKHRVVTMYSSNSHSSPHQLPRARGCHSPNRAAAWWARTPWPSTTSRPTTSRSSSPDRRLLIARIPCSSSSTPSILHHAPASRHSSSSNSHSTTIRSIISSSMTRHSSLNRLRICTTYTSSSSRSGRRR